MIFRRKLVNRLLFNVDYIDKALNFNEVDSYTDFFKKYALKKRILKHGFGGDYYTEKITNSPYFQNIIKHNKILIDKMEIILIRELQSESFSFGNKRFYDFSYFFHVSQNNNGSTQLHLNFHNHEEKPNQNSFSVIVDDKNLVKAKYGSYAIPVTYVPQLSNLIAMLRLMVYLYSWEENLLNEDEILYSNEKRMISNLVHELKDYPVNIKSILKEKGIHTDDYSMIGGI